MPDAAKTARVFGALSAESRVRMLQLLKDGPLCVGALAGRLNLTSGAVSQHLRILRDAGLVVPEKRGYFVHYRINGATLARWKRIAQEMLSIRQD